MSWLIQRRVERRATRMHEMMKRLDVDPRVLGRASPRRCLCGSTLALFLLRDE
jgi:hypothetical protein